MPPFQSPAGMMMKGSVAMTKRFFLTPLTPRACHARLNETLATPFLTWFSESGVDGRTDERGFDVWPVASRGEYRAGHLRGHYRMSPSGAVIVSEFLPPPLGLPSLWSPSTRRSDQETFLVAFLMHTLNATEVTAEEATRIELQTE